MNEQIYALLLNKNIVYVGASVNPKQRLTYHKNRLKKSFTIQILNKHPKDWIKSERYYIKKHKPRYNQHPGGTGCCSGKQKVDAQYRENRRQATLKAWQDPEKRERLLERNKKRWSDPKAKEKHIKLHLGSKRPLVTKQRISSSIKARGGYGGIRNPNAKLNIKDVQDIRKRAEKSSSLALLYGVNVVTIRSIRNRKSWKDIK